MYEGKKVALVIPFVKAVSDISRIMDLCPDYVDRVVVVAPALWDGTGDVNVPAKVEVVTARHTGYGSACLSGLECLGNDPPDVVVFARGEGGDDLSMMDRLLIPIAREECDLVLGSRRLEMVQSGVLTQGQRAVIGLGVFLIDLVWAEKFTDFCHFRAIRWEALERLSMSDLGSGWNVEMQIKAVRHGLRMKEVPVAPGNWQDGGGGIGDTITGALSAGRGFLGRVLKEAVEDRKFFSLGFASYAAAIVLVMAHVFNRPIFSVNGRPMYLVDLLVFVFVLLFGLYRFFLKDHPYQRLRIHVIVWLYLIFWGLMPYLFGLSVPVINGGWVMWPAIHVIGSVMFFAYGFLMIFFGRRLDCGWNCPCVATRETVGFAFRRMTPRGRLWWGLRYLKYPFLAFMLVYLAWILLDPLNAYNKVGRYYYTALTETYYFSYLFLPLFGNRSYCRILCPYAALWGIYSRIGLYRIEAAEDRCTRCGLCESVCDMGIPIRDFVKKGRIKTVECMGCGRCVNICPRGVLEIKSAWTFFRNAWVKFRKKRSC